MIKSITIPDEHVAEMVEVYGRNYQPLLMDETGEINIPNPQTKTQFANAQLTIAIRGGIRAQVMRYRSDQAVVNVDTTDITAD